MQRILFCLCVVLETAFLFKLSKYCRLDSPDTLSPLWRKRGKNRVGWREKSESNVEVKILYT